MTNFGQFNSNIGNPKQIISYLTISWILKTSIESIEIIKLSEFILDFKCVTPRVDPRSGDGPFISLKHNVVMMDVFHAKRFLEFLKKRIDDYEKEFGKIEKPKQIMQLEKKRKKESKKEKISTPEYFG